MGTLSLLQLNIKITGKNANLSCKIDNNLQK